MGGGLHYSLGTRVALNRFIKIIIENSEVVKKHASNGLNMVTTMKVMTTVSIVYEIAICYSITPLRMKMANMNTITAACRRETQTCMRS